MLLTYLAVLWANMTSLPLFARFFLDDTFQVGFRYTVFGYDVWLGEALLSVCAVVLIGVLCTGCRRLPNIIMIVAALMFTAGFTVCALLAVLRHESTFSYAPLYTEGSNAFAQIVRIAAISPWAFIGFENISFFSGEETDFLFEDISCSVPATDESGLTLAENFQARLPENQMSLRRQETTLLMSKAMYGGFDVIFLSKEMYDSCGAKSISKLPFVVTVESEGVQE